MGEHDNRYGIFLYFPAGGRQNKDESITTIIPGTAVFNSVDRKDLLAVKKIIWKCIAACIDVATIKNKSEWLGTKIICKINQADKEISYLKPGTESRTL